MRHLSFKFVVPTESLRDLLFRQFTKMYPELNYCCEWLDARGFGIMLAEAEWNKGKPMYHVPPTTRGRKMPVGFSQEEIRLAATTYGRDWRWHLTQEVAWANEGPYGRNV